MHEGAARVKCATIVLNCGGPTIPKQFDGENQDAGGAALGRSTVNVHPLPGRLRTRISPPFARTPFRLTAGPSPHPVLSAPRCSKGRNRPAALPGGSPPHSSSTSISTRSPVVWVLTLMLPWGRV